MRKLLLLFLFALSNVQLFAIDQPFSKKDSLLALSDSIRMNESIMSNKILFFKTFPESFSEMELIYGNSGSLKKYALDHQNLFLKIISDTNLISKTDGIDKIIKIVSNYEPSVDNLGEFYATVSVYLKDFVSISDLISFTSESERNSLIRFLGQSHFPFCVQLLESYLRDQRMKAHHVLIKATLKKLSEY